MATRSPAEFIETDVPEPSLAASPSMSLPSCVCEKANEINKKSDSVLVKCFMAFSPENNIY